MSDVILSNQKAGESIPAKQPRLYIHCWMKLNLEREREREERRRRRRRKRKKKKNKDKNKKKTTTTTRREEEERERERETSTYLPGLRAERTVRVDWFVGVATLGLTPTIEGRKQNWIWCALSVPGEELEGVCCHCCSFLCARPFALG